MTCYLLLGMNRMERYNLCFVELEKVKCCLPALTRLVINLFSLHGCCLLHVWKSYAGYVNFMHFISCRRGGSVAKAAQELNLALQEVSWLTLHTKWKCQLISGSHGSFEGENVQIKGTEACSCESRRQCFNVFLWWRPPCTCLVEALTTN